jgi:hypothetical protein
MRGYQTNMPEERDIIRAMPPNYYENSFAAFSQNHLDFVRYLIIGRLTRGILKLL